MNVLVTNTYTGQAYSIIRSLRPHAKKIVVTMCGRNRLAARVSTAANSRLVDKRYYVPHPAKDWLGGHVQEQNTEREEAYLQRIMEICRKEDIDTIFPSYDPQVYVFSKNKERFLREGILIPVPDFDVVRIALDKYQSVELARKAGFPHPRTYLPKTEDELREIAEALDPPWLIRPRLTAGSKGMAFVSSLPELVDSMKRIQQAHAQPMVQEYIPGKEHKNFYIVLDRGGEPASVLCPTILHYTRRLYRDSGIAAESSKENPFIPDVLNFVRELGWWGGLTIQTKIDPRDQLPKLMEINPRLGSHLWYRTELGMNEPLMNLQIARGEEPVPTTVYPEGTLLLEPLEDFFGFGFETLDLLLYKCRRLFRRGEPLDLQNQPMSFGELVGVHLKHYFSKKNKVYMPEFRYMFSDPLVCLLWSYVIVGYALTGIKKLGR